MNDLPEDLAKPQRDWPIGDIMGIVVGGVLLIGVVAALVAYLVVPHA